jgi:large subunit ribosomal protein L22
MQVTASTKFVRISPKKVRPFLGDLRGKKVTPALAALKFSPNKSGRLLYKLIQSAAANALNNYNLKQDNLKIKTLQVDEGPRYRRYWFRSHGSADLLLKRTAHLSVVLEEILPTVKPVPPKKKAATSGTASQGATPVQPSDEQKMAPGEKKLATPEIKKPRGRGGIKRIFTRTTNK